MTPTVRQILLVIKRIVIVIGIAVAFSLGLMGAIYLSLRSSQTRVPDVVGKDRAAAETTIEDAGLNFRVRATRATAEAKPDTVLIQLPAAGVTVKVGQTVAVDISRATNGETTTPSSTNENTSTENKNQNTSSISASPSPTPKKKPANRNANDNANANLSNQNRNANANRVMPNLNGNANRTATPPASANTNSGNTNRPHNANDNRRPVPAPTP
ncbi:MAG TPA: PASTA domain-containing protein [Pyrinomonadaceae bacterium]|nr:PASTA domain-containing protein [Pyrinomonadaceae bacterium]